MKNSTLHRSNLSKERMSVLNELRAQRVRRSETANAPGVYKRPNKQKELDVLWQSFKLNQKEEKSPGAYLLTGFVAGALCMFLMTAMLSIGSNNSEEITDSSTMTPKMEKKLIKRSKSSKLAIIPSDKPEVATPSTSEQYTVQSGDTLEGIIIRFYGSYDVSKVDKIKTANGLANPNNLSIGQKLTIPLE